MLTESRGSIFKELQQAGRALSTATVRYHRVLAACLGLNDTDHKCLEILLREGAMTAGELSERAGYTTGAITGIVSRLVRQELITREADPADRRRVVLTARAQLVHERMWPFMQNMVESMGRLHAGMSREDLQLVEGYLKACARILEEAADALPRP